MLDLQVKVKKFNESEKKAIFSTSPKAWGGGLTNGHLVNRTKLSTWADGDKISLLILKNSQFPSHLKNYGAQSLEK